MTNLKKIDFQTLKEMSADNNPDVLEELADRYYESGDEGDAQKSAEKFYKLAAQLGSKGACRKLGKIYENTDPIISESYYYRGYRRGDAACIYHFALILIEKDEQEALDLMTFGAESGSKECARYLSAFYDKRGDTAQSEFFKALAE